jgi:hypothetical protein
MPSATENTTKRAANTRMDTHGNRYDDCDCADEAGGVRSRQRQAPVLNSPFTSVEAKDQTRTTL